MWCFNIFLDDLVKYICVYMKHIAIIESRWREHGCLLYYFFPICCMFEKYIIKTFNTFKLKKIYSHRCLYIYFVLSSVYYSIIFTSLFIHKVNSQWFDEHPALCSCIDLVKKLCVCYFQYISQNRIAKSRVYSYIINSIN